MKSRGRLAALAVVLAATVAAPVTAEERATVAPTPAAVEPLGPGVPIAARGPVLAIHGGAGVLARDQITPELDAQYRAALNTALDAGYAVLERGGSSLDAVEAAVRVLEDDPLFNAGRGAVFTWDGRNELDASIMDGATRKAGAVTGVTHVRHPVTLARRVMEQSPHVMLSGAGAEEFALEQQLELVPRSFFHTERRWEQLQRARSGDRIAAAENASIYFGTVGAVALDAEGRLAAATSTGGMTAKRWGRIGDAPIIGAGTYATDRVAVSATGDGEYFIRAGVAKDIAARMAYGGQPLDQAARGAIGAVGELGGEGGVITLGADGTVVFEFNSPGMFRGYRDSQGARDVAIYR